MMWGKRFSVAGVSRGEERRGGEEKQHTEGEEKAKNFVHSPIDIRLSCV